MKKVVLIGDSIRMGYEPFVRRELSQEAEVWAPEENGGTSRNVLAHLDEWVLALHPDIVHLNCGLHDLRREFGSPNTAVSIEEYCANVETILRRLLKHTSARVIWATTTPVNQQWHHERKGFDRFETDVLDYNRQAGAIAQRLGIVTNDLYDLVMGAGRDDLLQPDGVHFSEAGSALLGHAVAELIRSLL